jgi:integrase
MGIGKLTALQVTRLAKGTKPRLVGDGGGLYLQVTPRGASWIFRYRVDRKRLRDMGLGPLATIGLAEARERARQCRVQRLDGLDPIEERRQQRQQRRLDVARAMTFRQCAEAYIAAHQAGWRNAVHARQWPNSLRDYVYPVFGDLPVQAIDVGLVMKAIGPLWTTKTETASRVRGRVESVLDWAKVSGYRDGENPARWKGHLENLLPKTAKVKRVEHHAALPYPEIGTFMAELRLQKGVGAQALEFAILTAARTGEVLGARWSEVSLADRLWTIPAERMKSGREHRVPLSDAALAILKVPHTGEFIFGGGPAALRQALHRLGRDDLTAHGFRSAFADWCAERTAFASEVREMALAHAVSDKVEAAYRRGDLFEKRRQLADAWARFCSAPATTGEVIAIGR